MKTIKLRCPICETEFHKLLNQHRRSIKMGWDEFCSKQCSNLSRRNNKPIEQKKLEKKEYDKIYRHKNKEDIKLRKQIYFQCTYDPIKAAKERKKRMPKHVEYCRQPKYKAYKKKYDRKYRAKKQYGGFWESKVLLLDIDQHLKEQSNKYDIALQNETLNKKQKRRRNYEKLNSNKS